MNEKLEDFNWVLVDQIVDLTIATDSLRKRINSTDFDPEEIQDWAYVRMCTSSLIMSLWRISEAFKHYGKEIEEFPSDVKEAIHKIKKTITDKGIPSFRSKYIAHIIDKDTKKILSYSKGKELYNKILGKNADEILTFCDWIYPMEYDKDPESVMWAIVKSHDYILEIIGKGSSRP